MKAMPLYIISITKLYLRGCISLDGMSIVITVVTSRGDAGLTDCSYQCLIMICVIA